MNQRSNASAIAGCLLAFVSTANVALAAQTPQAKADNVARGRYLVKITGCNDCHTDGYAMADGKVPESEWLKGDALGWQGPWGTTYAPNLRLFMKNLTEAQWIATARVLKSRPPMPSFSLNAMNEADLRAVYRYVRSLQPLGEPAPAYLPPGVEAKGPVVKFPAPPPK